MKQKAVHILVICYLIIFAACQSERPADVPWYLDTRQLQQDYLAAVEDARVALPEEICRTLPAITSPGENAQIEWINENGENRLLVCSMMNADEAKAWPEGQDLEASATILAWVTLPYDLEAHVRTLPKCRDSLECRMRMVQLLGLPPDYNCDRLVFFYVAPGSLLRPTPDPEIDDSEASLTFSAQAPNHYQEWFAQNSEFSSNSETPYPWTRLGYTYNWNSESADHIGPGEFVVHPRAKVRVKRHMSAWSWYNTRIIPLHK